MVYIDERGSPRKSCARIDSANPALSWMIYFFEIIFSKFRVTFDSEMSLSIPLTFCKFKFLNATRNLRPVNAP